MEEEENKTSNNCEVPFIQLENVGFERENANSENKEAVEKLKNENLPTTVENNIGDTAV